MPGQAPDHRPARPWLPTDRQPDALEDVGGSSLRPSASAQHAFDAVAEPTITYGTTDARCRATSLPAPISRQGNVAVTLNGVTQSAAIDPASGNFSSVFTTSGLGVLSSPYTITYSYAGDGNFTAVRRRST